MSQENEIVDSESTEESIETIANEMFYSRQAMEANYAMYVALESIMANPHVKNSPLLAHMTLGTAMEAMGVQEYRDYSKLSLEELAREKIRFWDRFKHHFADFYKRSVDNLQTFFTFTQFQTGRIKRLKAALNQVHGNPKVGVRTSMSKYMRYGRDESIRDSKMYLTQFEKMKAVMTEVCKSAADLNDQNRFNIPSYLISKTVWKGDEFVMDHFEALDGIVRGAINKERMKLERRTERAEVYATDNMLGMSQVVCKVPLKANVRFNDYDSAVENVNLYYMFVDRIEKFSTETLSSKSDYMDFDKKQISVLLDMCEELASEAVELIGITEKYNSFLDNFMATLFYTAPILSAIYKDTRMDAQDVDITPSIRIISRYISMTYDCTSSSYNYSMGNIKKALSMVESYLAQATK